MRADEAWRIGSPTFDWCGNCKRKPGPDVVSKHECGHITPVLARVSDLGEEKTVRCYCITPDITKLNGRLGLGAGKQEELF